MLAQKFAAINVDVPADGDQIQRFFRVERTPLQWTLLLLDPLDDVFVLFLHIVDDHHFCVVFGDRNDTIFTVYPRRGRA